ncbi:type II toxin-antitoxin system RelE/ParE family toxin [Patescibacteria group bacterium]|nr:type II toxin-antitoxin system RelE/ParE family toxin [Patescibacteria group bacterium]MBU1931182.1 type II toxin-antitoxin system RelE/ParE family toxin [Patescibacteria group bacterium]
MLVQYSDTARKQLKKLPQNKQIKILKKIKELKNNPYAGKKLIGGFKKKRCLRTWPYRIIYQYFSLERRLFINLVEHRQSAYK